MNTLLLLAISVLKNKCAVYRAVNSIQHWTFHVHHIHIHEEYTYFFRFFLGLMLTWCNRVWMRMCILCVCVCVRFFVSVCECTVYTEHIRYSLARLPLFLICFHTHLSVQVVGNKLVYIIATAFRVLIMHRVFLCRRFRRRRHCCCCCCRTLPSMSLCPSRFLGRDFARWLLYSSHSMDDVDARDIQTFMLFKGQFSSTATATATTTIKTQ